MRAMPAMRKWTPSISGNPFLRFLEAKWDRSSTPFHLSPPKKNKRRRIKKNCWVRQGSRIWQ